MVKFVMGGSENVQYAENLLDLCPSQRLTRRSEGRLARSTCTSISLRSSGVKSFSAWLGTLIFKGRGHWFFFDTYSRNRQVLAKGAFRRPEDMAIISTLGRSAIEAVCWSVILNRHDWKDKLLRKILRFRLSPVLVREGR